MGTDPPLYDASPAVLRILARGCRRDVVFEPPITAPSFASAIGCLVSSASEC